MYYCRVVHVLLYIPMKIEGEGGSMDPQAPPPESAPGNEAREMLALRN